MSTEAAIKVLLVEDNPGDARLVEILLSEVDAPRIAITRAERLQGAVGHLGGRHRCDYLLDLSLPDSGGLETVSRMRVAAPHAPRVGLSGQHDEEIALRLTTPNVKP
jgi:CheY-like chemotaxis protein